MAIFNPQVQPDNVRDPNYFKFSDSISQPKADTSGAFAGAALGTAIEGGAALADTVVKGIIKDEVYDRVDKERTDFAQALTNTRDYGSPLGPQRSVPSPVGENGPQQAPVDILADTNPQSVPTSIKAGIAKAGTVQAALDGEKISQTTYYQRIGDIAKSMRADHPGYRDYIDQQISKITGVDPANAYISSIISDINRQGANATKESDFWRQKIVNSGYPGWNEVLTNYERTGDHNKVAQFLAQNDGIRSSLQLKQAAFTSGQNDKTTTLVRAEDLATTTINTAATSMFYNVQKFANGDSSPAQIADRMADLSLHPEKANDVAYQNLSERYKALETSAYNQTMQQLHQRTKNSDGTYNKSVADVLGTEKVKKMVSDGVGALFSKTNEFISDKQFGPAYSLQNQASAIVNNRAMQVLQDPSVGGTVQTMAVFNKLAPNIAPLLLSQELIKGLNGDIAQLVTQQGVQGIAQTGGKYQGIDGKVYSFKQSLEELEQAGNMTKQAIPGQAIQNLLQVRKAITDPGTTPEALTNAVKYLYDPKANKGSLDKVMDDYYDPTRREVIKGRSSAFADMTAPDVTSAIKKSTPENWAKYTKWAKEEFATQLGTKVRDLNDIQMGHEYNISWNSDTKQLQLNFGDINPATQGKPVTGIAASVLNSSYRSVNNLNKGLSNIANLAKEEGTSIDAYIFRTLRENGFSPAKDVDGVPAQIMRALIVGNGGKVKDHK